MNKKLQKIILIVSVSILLFFLHLQVFAGTENNIPTIDGSLNTGTISSYNLREYLNKCENDPLDDDLYAKAYYQGDSIDTQSFYYDYWSNRDRGIAVLQNNSKILYYTDGSISGFPNYVYISNVNPNNCANNPNSQHCHYLTINGQSHRYTRVFVAKNKNTLQVNSNLANHNRQNLASLIVLHGVYSDATRKILGSSNSLQYTYTDSFTHQSLGKRINRISPQNEEHYSCDYTYVAKCGDGVIDNGRKAGNENTDGKYGILVNGHIIKRAGGQAPTETCEPGVGKLDSNWNVVPLGTDEICDPQTCKVESQATDGLCNPQISGAHIYHLEDQGGYGPNDLNVNLCNEGNPTAVQYNQNTHTWTWTCEGINGGANMTCESYEDYCGDGIQQDSADDVNYYDTIPSEQCDDGNTNPDDGCSPTCQLYQDPLCNTDYSGANIYDLNNNGNYLTDQMNLCTVGTLSNFTYNANTATRSWNCSEGGQTIICEAYEHSCGDNNIDNDINNFDYIVPSDYTGEQCDFGDQDNGDGCDQYCHWETPICSGGVWDERTPSLITSFGNTLTGGNPMTGHFDVDAVYDTNNWVNVTQYYFTSANYINIFGPYNVLYQTSYLYSGAGTYNYGFWLQNSLINDQNYGRRCTGQIDIIGVCGNGIIEGTEQCDDGNTDSNDGCNNNCELETPVCSGGVGRTPWNVEANFGQTLSNVYAPFTGYFSVDGVWNGTTNNNGIQVAYYYFSGFDTNLQFLARPNVVYYTGHYYTQTGIAEYGFLLINSINHNHNLTYDDIPKIRCTGLIDLNGQPPVHVTKLQRNWTRNLPEGLENYTGAIVNYMSGDIVKYKLVVGNSGDVATNQDISLIDLIGTGIQLSNWWTGNDCQNTNVNGDINLGWTLTNLQAGQTCTIYLSGIIVSDDYSTGLLSGMCLNPYQNIAGLVYNNTPSTGFVYGQYLPGNLEITKNFDLQTGVLGGNVVLTIDVYNAGQRNLYNLYIYDQLSQYLSGNGSWGNLLTGIIPYLAPGTTGSLTWNLDISDNESLSGTYIINTGYVVDTCLGEYSSTDTLFVRKEFPSVSVTKLQRNWTACQGAINGSNNLDPNIVCQFTGNNITIYNQDDVIEYQLLVSNTGLVPARIDINDQTTYGLEITNQSFDGFESDFTFDGTLNTNNLHWYGTINSQTTGIIYLTGQITSWNNISYFQNNVNVLYENGEDQDSVIAYKNNVGIAKYQRNITAQGDGAIIDNGDIYFQDGDEFAYRLRYWNNTNSVIHNVKIVDNYPSGFNYSSYESTPIIDVNNFSHNSNTNTLTRTIGDLNPGDSGEIIIHGTLLENTLLSIYTNTGYIIYDGGTGEDSTNAILNGNFNFIKLQRNGTLNENGAFTHNSIIVQSGNVVEYQIYFENPTNQDIELNIMDILPNGFTPTNWNSTSTYHNADGNGQFPSESNWPVSNYTQDGYKYRQRNFGLIENETGVLYISGYISNTEQFNIYTNTGLLECYNEQGEYCGGDWSEVTAFAAQFTFEKFVSPNPSKPGDTVTFKLCMKNNGANSINSYTITDLLPNTMEYLGNVKYEASGGTISGSITQAPTITKTNSGYTIYQRLCSRLGQLSNINGLCPLPAGTGGNACIIFDAKSKY